MGRNDISVSDYDERVKRTFGDIEKKRNNKHSIQYADGKVPYMAQENVKQFNEAILKKTFSGRPMKWDNVENLQNELSDFFKLCDDTATIPTVTGIATWLGCNRDTLYAHANNPNSPFSDTIKRVMSVCQLSLENGAVGGKVNSVLYMFLGKNYFGLKDDKNITVSSNNDTTITNSQETMDAIQKQLEQENVPNATFTESS